MTDSLTYRSGRPTEEEEDELDAEVDALREKLHRIKGWCEAYPVKVFPEPDLAKAQQLLQAGGMSIDAISASNMRHVLKGVLAIIEEPND